MQPNQDEPRYLDGWDELSTVLDDDPELRELTRLGYGVDADPQQLTTTMARLWGSASTPEGSA